MTNLSKVLYETRLAARGHDVRLLELFTWAVGGGHGIRIEGLSKDFRLGRSTITAVK